MSSSLFKMLPTNYLSPNHIYKYMYKEGLVLNNLQELMYYKTQLSNQCLAE